MGRALLIVVGCILCLSQAGLASPFVLKLFRPNTGYTQFLNDRSACLQATRHAQWTDYSASGASWTGESISYDVRAFGGCMNARGYVADPNGYGAIRYQLFKNGNYRVEVL
jgi:hypothetical protein